MVMAKSRVFLLLADDDMTTDEPALSFVGVGLSLAIHGVEMVAKLSFWGALDCILTAIVAGIITIYSIRQQDSTSDSRTSRRSPPPIGLYLLVVALILAIIKMVGTNRTGMGHSCVCTSCRKSQVDPGNGRWTDAQKRRSGFG